MRIFAVFAEKVGSCWCVTHVHVFITWTVWTHLWKPFPRACGSVPNVKTRYCLREGESYTVHYKDFSLLKNITRSLGLLRSRQPDTEHFCLICSKACVNLIELPLLECVQIQNCWVLRPVLGSLFITLVLLLFLDQSTQSFGRGSLSPTESLPFILSSLSLQKLLLLCSSGQINKAFAQAYLNR